MYLAGFSDNIATASPKGTLNMWIREWKAPRRVPQLPAKVFVLAIDRVRPLGETWTEWVMQWWINVVAKDSTFFWFTSVIYPCRMLGEQNKKFANHQPEVSDLQNFLKWSQLQAKAPNQMESKLKRFFITLAGNGNLLFIGLTLLASILDSFSRDAF